MRVHFSTFRSISQSGSSDCGRVILYQLRPLSESYFTFFKARSDCASFLFKSDIFNRFSWNLVCAIRQRRIPQHRPS